MNPAHTPYAVPPQTPHPSPLHVVTCVNNYNRYNSRLRLYRSFEHHVQSSGAILHTAECALDTRPFEVTDPSNPRHIQVRTKSELWHKENLMNIALSRLPGDAEYIAFIDADFIFARPDWAHETVQQLQHTPVVQMFSTVGYLDANHEQHGTTRVGFVEAWRSGQSLRVGDKLVKGGDFFTNRTVPGVYGDSFGPPGGAWAFRRSALDQLGGLMDFGVLGSSDYFMALAFVGCAQHRIPAGYHPNFKAKIMAWQENALHHIRRNLGVVPGTIWHYFHGDFSHRKYSSREQILIRAQFDPDRDLRRNSYGVYEWVDDGSRRMQQLRDDVRSYFRVRNEDSIDLVR
jgi:Glycosyl transferase family 2